MYRFGVDADIGSATEKLNKIVELMDTIDGLNKKGKDNYFHSSQKDIDTNVKAMQEMIRLSKELERQLQSLKSVQASKGDFGGISAINDQIKSVQKNLDETRNKFQQLGDNRQSMSGLNRETVKEQQRYNSELQDEIKYLREVKSLTRDLNATERRVKSRSNSYSSAGKATFNQANVLRGDMDTLSTAGSMREDNELRINDLNKQINTIDQELSQLAKNTSKTNQERINEESALKNSRRVLEDTIKAFQEMNTTIGGFDETIKQTANKMNDVKVDANPESIAGQIASRSNSIGIAIMGSLIGSFAGMYSKGATANKAMREPSIRAGQVTGNSDFRAVRKQAQEAGLEKGINYKGGEMLEFQDSILSSMGFKGQESLNDTTRTLAEGSRAVPVDNETLSNFMESNMRSGAVDSATQAKAIQEAFLGAIEQSGMVGREKEQLDALNSISSQVFAGRNGNNDELNNLVALQTLFSEKGGRALQGENGSKVMSSLDEGIRNSIDDPMLSLVFGKGTKYQGMDGRFKLREQLDKGISDPDNLKTMMNYANAQQGGMATDDAKMEYFTLLADKMGASLRPDEVKGIFESSNGFKDLDDDTLAKISEENKGLGSDKYGQNAEDYKNSKEGTADRSEAVTEYQASKTNDYGDVLRSINSNLGGLPTPLYLLTTAVTALTATLAMSGGMSGISSVIKGFTKTKFGSSVVSKAGDVLGKTKLGTKAMEYGKSIFTGAGSATATEAGTGLFSKLGGFFKGGAETAGKSGGMFGKLGGLFKGGAESGGLLSKAGGFLGKAGGVLGKVAPWLAVGSAVADIATSDDKVKATGKNGGMLAGMAGGSALGTAIMPGIGTLIGGVGGAFLGSKAGEGLVNAGRGAIDWSKEKLGGVTEAIKDGFSWGKDKITDGLKGAFNIGKDVISKGMDIITAPDKMVKKGISSMWNWGKEKVSGFFGGETAEASEIQQSGLSAGKDKASNKKSENKAKNEEEKDTNNKKYQSEKVREKNIIDENANLSFYSTLLDRAKQILVEAKAQNGIFGNSNGGSGGDSSGGTSGSGSLDYLGDGKKWTNEDITKHDLGKTVMGLTAKELDEWIDSVAPEGSAMRGMGADFLEAGKQSGLDPRYLIAHSAVETGWGTSALSKNGDKNAGNWFGIGAFDNDPNNGFKYGDGLTGGAKWIADNFYSAGQTTLETMRHNGGQHEYATDPDWDKKIASIMKGSESYTKGKAQAQTFSTANSVNVTVNDAGSASGARQVGARVASAVTEGLNSAIDFYSKELKRA